MIEYLSVRCIHAEALVTKKVVITFGGSAGQASPGWVSSGMTTNTPSALSDQPMSCAEHSMPKLSTPRTAVLLIVMPEPGTVMPMPCSGTKEQLLKHDAVASVAVISD